MGLVSKKGLRQGHQTHLTKLPPKYQHGKQQSQQYIYCNLKIKDKTTTPYIKKGVQGVSAEGAEKKGEEGGVNRKQRGKSAPFSVSRFVSSFLGFFFPYLFLFFFLGQPRGPLVGETSGDSHDHSTPYIVAQTKMPGHQKGDHFPQTSRQRLSRSQPKG